MERFPARRSQSCKSHLFEQGKTEKDVRGIVPLVICSGPSCAPAQETLQRLTIWKSALKINHWQHVTLTQSSSLVSFEWTDANYIYDDVRLTSGRRNIREFAEDAQRRNLEVLVVAPFLLTTYMSHMNWRFAVSGLILPTCFHATALMKQKRLNRLKRVWVWFYLSSCLAF